MKTKNKILKSLMLLTMLTGIAAVIVSVSAFNIPDRITISNEHLYYRDTAKGIREYKFVMDISFPNPSDIRNPHVVKIVDGIYSIKLNRIDGKKTELIGCVAMDYKSIGDASAVQATIFDSDGGKPLATSKPIAIKGAEPE